MPVNRRSQASRSAATSEALVAAARPLFAEHGFAAVGTEAIVQAAGVTRGALYHQFADKTELFAAVFEQVELDVMRRIGAELATAVEGEPDPIAVMRLGAAAWLEACAAPEVERIALIDGPAVLGWERWRAVALEHGLGLLVALLERAMATGAIAEQPVRPLAHLLGGAMDEAALYVSRSTEPDVARAEMLAALERLVGGLAA